VGRLAGWMRGGLVCILILTLLPLPLAAPPRVLAANPVRWGYYVPTAASSLASLRAAVDAFTHISPTYFLLKEDGTITSTEQPAVTAMIRSRAVKVLPMIQNTGQYDRFRAMLDTPEKMQAVLDRVVAIALRPEYDGIHIDFEGIDGGDRALLTTFMARLYERVHPFGKLVTQAVGAKTTDTRTGWSGAYDYAALAQYNDLIIIMAYDYHYAGGDPGPIAPIDWVRRVGGYSASTIGLDKTVLGINLYGYRWIVNKSPRERAAGVSYEGAVQLIERHNGQRGYDQASESEWGRYQVGEEQHEIWFESARSLEPKLAVVTGQGLAGFAFWRLGHEDPALWQLLKGVSTPATAVAPIPTTPEQTYFIETRHTLRGGFYRYWRQNGGLARFGFPLTEEFEEADPATGTRRVVQYFERARFEYNASLAGTPFEVQLGHLGRWALERAPMLPPGPRPAPPGALVFPETGRSIQQGFRAYWEANGGLAQFGLPLTDEYVEIDPWTGLGQTVQYFERARFEYHPQLEPAGQAIQLTLLGRAMLREREWVR
jgi:spore germination protein